MIYKDFDFNASKDTTNHANVIGTDYDTVFLGSYLDSKDLSRVRKWLNLKKDEPALMFSAIISKGENLFSIDKNYITCITEEGISFCFAEKTLWSWTKKKHKEISWSEMYSIEAVPMDTHFNLIIEDDNIKQIRNKIKIHTKSGHSYVIPFFHRCDIETKTLADFINNVKDFLSIPNNTFKDYFKKLYYKSQLEHLLESLDIVDENYTLKAHLIDCLIECDKIDEAEKEFNHIEKDYQLHTVGYKTDFIPLVLYTYHKSKGLINQYRKNYYDAALNFQSTKSTFLEYPQHLWGDISEYDIRSQIAYELYIKQFDTLPYAERKIIIMTDTENLFKTKSITLLQLNKLPNNLKFSTNSPIKNRPYICHPYDNNTYLSIDDYDMELLNDRVNEYCYLMQCLGATDISIKNIKGNEHRCFTFDKEQFFNPTKKPFIPENLIWFPHEVSWQKLAKQRLSGAVLQHNEFISSSQNKLLTDSEIDELNSNLSFISNSYLDSYQQINTSIDVEWEISVSFKPIDNFEKGNTVSDFSDSYLCR